MPPAKIIPFWFLIFLGLIDVAHAQIVAPLTGNVINIGVGCDGTTPVDTQINAALTQAATKPESTVYFPPSSQPCIIANSLNVPSNVTLWATPGTATLKMSFGSSANPGILNVANQSNVLVYGLTFDGNLPGVPSGDNVNTVFKSSNVIFDHVTVQNTRGIGIVFSSGITSSGVRFGTFNNVGNYWITSGSNADQHQGIAFCCGTTLNTSATQGGPSPTISFSSTSGVVAGQLVSGTYIPAGSYVESVIANTSVTINSTPTQAIPSGEAISFTGNNGNFVTDSRFSSVGLDAISIDDQQNATVARNFCSLVGGRFSNGGACVYGANGYGNKLLNNISLLAFGNGLDLISQSSFLIDGDTAFKSGSRGIAIDSSAQGVVHGNHAIDNQQNTTSNGQGGINFSGLITNITVLGNDAHDDQETQTQPYGIGVTNGSVISGLFIGPDNLLAGNLTGAVGGGYGAIGLGATDLQQGKTNMNLSATGQYSLSAGQNVTSPGAWATSLGQWDTADGQASVALGEFAQTRFRRSLVFSAGQISNNGDSQTSINVLQAATTNTTPVILGAGGTGALNNSCVNLPNISPFSSTTAAIYGLDIDIVAIDTTSSGNFNHYHDANAVLYKTTTAGSVVFTPGSSPTNTTIGTAGSFSLSANTTYSCIAIQWTAPNTDTWHVTARVLSTETF